MNEKILDFAFYFLKTFIPLFKCIAFLFIGVLIGMAGGVSVSMHGMSLLMTEITAEMFEHIPIDSLMVVLLRGFLPIGVIVLLLIVAISLLVATKEVYFPRKSRDELKNESPQFCPQPTPKVK